MGEKSHHIVLTGLPGSGKTTLGKMLSEELRRPFTDLDKRIEEVEGKSVPAIFEERGEDYFRLREHQCLQEILEGEEGVVLSSGGGAPCFHHNMELIKKKALSIYLEVPFGILAERLLAEGVEKRPLLKGYADVERLKVFLEEKFNWRIPFYKKADLHFPNHSNADVQELVRKIQAGRLKQKS